MTTIGQAFDAAGLMDRQYRLQRHVYDATRKFYLLGRDDLIATLSPAPGAHVLEIGCGTGRNLIVSARTYPEATFYGVDVSSAMLQTARVSVRRAGLDARIHLAQGDARDFDPQTTFGRCDFDRIAISYALSMIPLWREVMRHAATLIAPGGSLRIVDFGDQAGLPCFFGMALERWLASFHVTPRPTLGQDVSDVASDLGLRASSRSSYRGYAITARIDRDC